ncbi:adenomatous polyposis coli protein 2-like [Gouania willdenowi]|nr:adenomatous polyposis coli protein 2-like [Gouania willdenowi]
MATFDLLAHQVEALRQENSSLRRELEDNSQHLCLLQTETVGMKEVLKQLQSKLEQEAKTLASSGRSDVLLQLRELHMDLTNYYELKHQPNNLRLGGARLTGVGGDSETDDHLAMVPLSCSASSTFRAASRQSAASSADAIMIPHHFLEGAPPKTAVMSGADGRQSDHHLEELYKER